MCSIFKLNTITKAKIAQIKFVAFYAYTSTVRTILTHIGVHRGNLLMYTNSHMNELKNGVVTVGGYRWVYIKKFL